MCELFCLSSRIATAATFSLRAFAQRGRSGAGPVDGWGLAYYDERDLRLYKEPEPAGDSAWLSFIESRRLPAKLVISHLRHATQGRICLANTQPFVRELGARMHVFAHNGRLESLTQRPPGTRFQVLGDTDSEVAFCLLLERLAPLWDSGAVPDLGQRLDLIAAFAQELRPLGPANFIYSDGDAVFAHGHRRTQTGGAIEPPGLWCLERQCACDPDALASAGVSLDAAPAGQRILLVASVPLTGEAWRPFAEGELAVIRNGELMESRLPA